MFRSLSVRLSLAYAACCLVSMAAVLLVCYLFLQSSLRRQTDAGLASEIPEYRALLASQNLDVLKDALLKEALSEGIDQAFFRIMNGSGAVLFATDTQPWKNLELDQSALQAALDGKLVFAGYHDPDRDFSARLLYGAVGDNLILQIGESLEGNRAILRQFREVFTLATLAFLLCSLLAGVYMARGALSGVERIARAADQITGGAWEHRVPVSRRHDELDDLAISFNTMVDRIQVLFRELRDVTDDIAHDLRTPLMRIRGESELALHESASDPDSQERYGSVLEECDQMLHLINTMLEISQTEAGAKPLERESLNLQDIAEDICDLFRPAAEDKGLTLRCDSATVPPFLGEASRLKRALAHLLDNAIKYTPEGGQIRLSCQAEGPEVLLSVSDTGIGIPAPQQEKIFGRFYRVESSRTTTGNGLGLSLARAIVHAHGGELTLESTEGAGATFTIRLPIP